MITILGIDPGSRITGYGLIKMKGQAIEYLDSGCIILKNGTLAERLHIIFEKIEALITLHGPEECAIEQVFMHRNPNSAIKLGQARGAALVAVARHALPIGEYAPREIKQAVVGYGAAEKSQIQHMIRILLRLEAAPQADAADALAIAICHANRRQTSAVLARALEKSGSSKL